MLQLLQAAVELRASELLMVVGAPPALRVDGEVIPLRAAPLSADDIRLLVYSVLNEVQQARWEKDRMLRLSFGVKGLSRYRMAVYEQRGTMAATLKVVPFQVPALDPALEKLKPWLQGPGGLYLLAGRSDSGRTWALSSLLDQVLMGEHVKVATANDPIELLHPHKNSYAEQFEAGSDFRTAHDGVERLLATGGDVLGWDFPLNHVESLVTLAQTGKRVFATMLAASAEQALAEFRRAAPEAMPLIQGVAYLELSPPAKGRPRELKATLEPRG